MFGSIGSMILLYNLPYITHPLDSYTVVTCVADVMNFQNGVLYLNSFFLLLLKTSCYFHEMLIFLKSGLRKLTSY